MQYVIHCAALILEVELLEHTFPQTKEELDAFDWSEVIVGRVDTYPKGTPPSSAEYEKVRTIHKLVKDEKDQAAAKKKFKSGAQSYTTFRQRWREWRQIQAIFRYMNKDASLQTVLDTATVSLKQCTSLPDMFTKIGLLIQTPLP